MADLATIDLIGFWIGIFLTFCILSFLYKDNPFYKFAEHLFIGVSVGYVVTKQYYDTLRPKLIANLGDGKWWYIFGAVLAVMLLLKLFRKTSHLGRYPIAFVVGLFAGLQITGVAQGDLGKQAATAMESVEVRQMDLNTATKAELQLLPGFSPIIANKVIERRAQRPFTSLDELTQLEGLTAPQIADLNEARGSIAGLDASATTLEVLPSSERAVSLADRAKAFLQTRDSAIKKLDAVIVKKVAKLAKVKSEVKPAPPKRADPPLLIIKPEDEKDPVADAEKALKGAKGDLAKKVAQYAEAERILSQLNDNPAPGHVPLSALERSSETISGTSASSRPGGFFLFGTLSKLLLLLGLIAGLIYFYFSIEQKGPVGKVSRFGVWILMIGFGASFGYTVQGRISLAIGRVLDISGANKDPNLAAQINGVTVAVISIAIIVAGLVVWELGQKKSAGKPLASKQD